MFREKKTILVVEDQTINRQIIVRILADDYYVLEAENGQRGLEMLKDNKQICAILLDLVMPVMDGFTFLDEMGAMKNNVPVVVMTGDNDIKTEEMALDMGAIDFIVKPVIPKILKSRLRNAIIRNQMYLLEELRFRADHDQMTGLFNRSRMFKETKKMLDAYPDKQFAFVRFDIDQFRLYNSAMGEEAGNRLICFIGESLPKMAEQFPYCTYGRIDADVFCMCEPYDENVIRAHAQQAQAELRAYRNDYVIDTSFGVYVIDDNSLSVETMFTRASMASDKCKNQYGQHIAFYEASMSQRVVEEQAIINEMEEALEKEQFQVYLQPKYDLNTDMPCGAEALVRWLHPEKGLISPGKFIPVFEKNGFIAKLDYYMWEHVCRLLHRWKQEGREIFPVSVNMSRVSLYNLHVTEILEELIHRYDIDVKELNLEVTETIYMSNPDLMKAAIRRLQKAGFLILMDDFGSGYSSLNTLKDINVDILKIDMKFMPNGEDDERSEKILSSIVRMAGWLGMPVIAEGVENREQKEFLESIGCGYVQGYYYAKPMPAADYAKLMMDVAVLEAKAGIDTRKDLNAVWSSNKQIEDILKGITLPVAIYECSTDKTDIIRVNQAYQDRFVYTRYEDAKGLLAPEYAVILDSTFVRAIQSGDTAECEFPFTDSSDTTFWYRARVRVIGSIPKSSLLCCVFTDVTKEKKFSQQLKKIETLFGQQQKKQMLIIDDLSVSRAILKQMFGEKYEILEAENGRQGLEILKENEDNIAMILLDMIMPEMDGEAFLTEKNRLQSVSDIPVVVISSERDAATQLGMLKMGVNDYITKPFDRDIVVQRVQNVLAYNSRFHELLKEYQTDLANQKLN